MFMPIYECHGYNRKVTDAGTKYQCTSGCIDFSCNAYSSMRSHLELHHPDILKKNKNNIRVQKTTQENKSIFFSPKTSPVSWRYQRHVPISSEKNWMLDELKRLQENELRRDEEDRRRRDDENAQMRRQLFDLRMKIWQRNNQPQ